MFSDASHPLCIGNRSAGPECQVAKPLTLEWASNRNKRSLKGKGVGIEVAVLVAW